jgi:hypothetical protein
MGLNVSAGGSNGMICKEALLLARKGFHLTQSCLKKEFS